MNFQESPNATPGNNEPEAEVGGLSKSVVQEASEEGGSEESVIFPDKTARRQAAKTRRSPKKIASTEEGDEGEGEAATVKYEAPTDAQKAAAHESYKMATEIQEAQSIFAVINILKSYSTVDFTPYGSNINEETFKNIIKQIEEYANLRTEENFNQITDPLGLSLADKVKELCPLENKSEIHPPSSVASPQKAPRKQVVARRAPAKKATSAPLPRDPDAPRQVRKIKESYEHRGSIIAEEGQEIETRGAEIGWVPPGGKWIKLGDAVDEAAAREKIYQEKKEDVETFLTPYQKERLKGEIDRALERKGIVGLDWAAEQSGPENQEQQKNINPDNYSQAEILDALRTARNDRHFKSEHDRELIEHLINGKFIARTELADKAKGFEKIDRMDPKVIAFGHTLTLTIEEKRFLERIIQEYALKPREKVIEKPSERILNYLDMPQMDVLDIMRDALKSEPRESARYSAIETLVRKFSVRARLAHDAKGIKNVKNISEKDKPLFFIALHEGKLANKLIAEAESRKSGASYVKEEKPKRPKPQKPPEPEKPWWDKLKFWRYRSNKAEKNRQYKKSKQYPDDERHEEEEN